MKNENYVIIYSPSCCGKPELFSVLCGTQKEEFNRKSWLFCHTLKVIGTQELLNFKKYVYIYSTMALPSKLILCDTKFLCFS